MRYLGRQDDILVINVHPKNKVAQLAIRCPKSCEAYIKHVMVVWRRSVPLKRSIENHVPPIGASISRICSIMAGFCLAGASSRP